jgi:26S proteasome regulatory subunit N11
VVDVPKIISSDKRVIGFRVRMAKGACLFVAESAIDSIIDQAEGGQADREVMGLMMGSIFRDDDGEYAVVTDAITSGLDADEISVRFDKDCMEDLFESIDRCGGSEVVGWYHSHPGYGCYLSERDIMTHRGLFGDDTGFAMVIDPSDSSIVVFSCVGGKPEKAPMVVLESE